MEPNINRNTSSDQKPSPMKEKTINKDSSSSVVTDSEDVDKRKITALASVGAASTKKGSSAAAGSASSMKSCQAERCSADLSRAKTYHRRHKVCELHAKAQAVLVAGIRQRFCQQCSRFHELPEFDDSKRSCRRRLAGHNERRRKNFADNNNNSHAAAEGSSTGGDRNLQFTVQGNANYKEFNVMR